MKKFVKRGLAAGLVLLMMWPGSMQVKAAEMSQNAETVSDVDSHIMPLAEGDIASSTDGDITWVIDSSGKLTVN